MVGAEGVVRGHGNAHGTIDAGEFFNGDYVLHVAKAGAAVFGGKDDAQHAHAAEFLDGLKREVIGFIPLHHVGQDFALGEFTQGFLEL
jgi:hypothetical protein